MKMKRVLSLLLALVMTMSLLTLPSYAEDAAALSDMTVAEQYDALMAMEDDDAAKAAYGSLTTEQQNALLEYAAEQMGPAEQEEYTVPQTVVFTDAGPFMPAVNVAPARKLMKAAPLKAPKTDDNGLEFTKNATDNGDGTYTITMEAWATGTSVTTTSTKPVDIVLVLDQSGSMAYDFNGNPTSTNSNRRQYAMKQAVNNFIDAVNDKYTEDGDHRMAIVTFGSSASTLQGWTAVDDDNFGTLHGTINGLPATPSGGTQTGLGMAQAETLMGSGYNYNGSNTDRQKVVILFTDGVPGQSGFDTSVATSAIQKAKTLKDAGVTVYTVGIFNGADTNQLYGAKADYGGIYDSMDVACTGVTTAPGCIWGATNWASTFNDVDPTDVPAGNRFLNYVSSNFNSTTEIGLERGSFDKEDVLGRWVIHALGDIKGYKITKNFDRTNTGYYLTANNSESLNTIFQTISQQIDTASTTLDSKAVVKDTISPYFEAPAGSDIKLYTAPYNGNSFGARGAATGVTASVDNNGVVSVTGFDYAKEFVSDTEKSDHTYGKKLIIEFTVSSKDGFLGGNNVPTNGEAAIYDKEGGTKVEEVSSPVVDVEIPEITVTAADKNVYLTNSLTEAQLIDGATVKCGDVDITDPSALAEWQKAYINIQSASGSLNNLTVDREYTLTATVSPKDATGTAATKTGSDTADINVFKPEVTFNDSTVYYGDTAPESYNGNMVSTAWKHGTTLDSDVTMNGTKPTLTPNYAPKTGCIADNKIAATEDIPVDVSFNIGNIDVTQYVTFKHQDCETDETIPTGAAFLLHVKTCTLTVKKDGWDSKDENQSFLFNVDGPKSMQVVVQKDGSVTIKNLPVGTYKVTEDGNWSWRYELVSVSADSVTLGSANQNATVTVTNKRINNKWLSGDAVCVNVDGMANRGTFLGN